MDGSKGKGNSRYGLYFDGGSIWYGEDGKVIIYYDDGTSEVIDSQEIGKKINLVVVVACRQDPHLLKEILELEGNNVDVVSYAKDEKITEDKAVAKKIRREFKLDDSDDGGGVHVYLVRENGKLRFEIR